MKKCSMEGCDLMADPRWYRRLPVCDGHGRSRDEEMSALRLALAEAQRENAIERDKREAAEIALAEDRCVCLCGCPISEHEGRMEDGEQCEHEDHECLRVAPAVLEIVGRVRLALETATRERDEARREAERLMVLVQGWYEGRARIGAHMTFVDQRFYDSVRCERTRWPGDDEHGDGGPPEE